MNDLNSPVDDLNTACAEARRQIRRSFAAAQMNANTRANLLAEALKVRFCTDCQKGVKHVHDLKGA